MVEVFLVGLVLFLALVLEFFDFPLAGALFTGLFERERLLSASDSESDALPGLNIAKRYRLVELISSLKFNFYYYQSNASIFAYSTI